MLTISITSVSAEKLFSRLKLSKEYHVTNETNWTFNKLFIENDIAKTNNYDSIINDFKGKKNISKIYIIVYIYFIYLN